MECYENKWLLIIFILPESNTHELTKSLNVERVKLSRHPCLSFQLGSKEMHIGNEVRINEVKENKVDVLSYK